MLRRVTISGLCFAAALGSMRLDAQSSAAPAIPDTPAGLVLRAWLDAFNSADSARLAAYIRQHEPDRSVQSTMRFREQTGGFDLLSIERSEPRRLQFTVKERKSPTTGFGVLEVSDAAPPRVVAFPIQAMGQGVSPATLRIDAATRARVIDTAIARLEEHYVFPDVAKRMGDSLRARRARGAYDSYDDALTFAKRLHDDVRELGRDKHLRVNYSPRPLPRRRADGATPSPQDRERQQRRFEAYNCGFDKAEMLDGNVGYLKFDMFADPEICGPTAAKAMNKLANARALIVDLRENGGGSPEMVAYVSSYLFSKRTHLNDLWTRRTNETEEFWTRDVPGPKFGGEKPVYVLTSSYTFSGAEEFTYNLKAVKRATIIGETTGGGAHPVSGQRIDDHFMIGVPFARAINPITRTNWEGTGVEPDIEVPASEALATAQRLIRERMQP